MIKTVGDEHHNDHYQDTSRGITDQMNHGTTDLLPCSQVNSRIDAYLHEAPLSIGTGDYCYIKVVKNHLEIGRAKIILEE